MNYLKPPVLPFYNKNISPGSDRSNSNREIDSRRSQRVSTSQGRNRARRNITETSGDMPLEYQEKEKAHKGYLRNQTKKTVVDHKLSNMGTENSMSDSHNSDLSYGTRSKKSYNKSATNKLKTSMIDTKMTVSQDYGYEPSIYKSPLRQLKDRSEQHPQQDGSALQFVPTIFKSRVKDQKNDCKQQKYEHLGLSEPRSQSHRYEHLGRSQPYAVNSQNLPSQNLGLSQPNYSSSYNHEFRHEKSHKDDQNHRYGHERDHKHSYHRHDYLDANSHYHNHDHKIHMEQQKNVIEGIHYSEKIPKLEYEKVKYPPRPPTGLDLKYDHSGRHNRQNGKTEKYQWSENSDCSRQGKSRPPHFLSKTRKMSGNNIQNFKVMKKLGKGSYGNVYLVREIESTAIFALKIMSKQQIRSCDNQKNIFRQLKIHLCLTNPHIIQLYSIFSDHENIYLVMEYLNEGSLFDILQEKVTLSQKKAAKIARQISDAVLYMHDNHIIHRDLKLQNIMSSNGVLKIGDFGCAVHTFNLRETKIGSLAYHSPEQLMEGHYDEKVDVWSLGIIVYELLYGETPFDKDIIKIVMHEPNARLSDLKFPNSIPISSQAKDFISKLLEKKPAKRLSIQSVKDHPFITTNSKDDSEPLSDL